MKRELKDAQGYAEFDLSRLSNLMKRELKDEYMHSEVFIVDVENLMKRELKALRAPSKAPITCLPRIS